MGLRGFHMRYIVALFCASLCCAATVSDSSVVLIKSDVSVHLGHTTTLPCWLNPQQSAEDMEVRWFRGNGFDTPIILYKEQKFSASQETSYKGRVSFGLKDAASGGMKTGDVSLQLVNVTIEDAGNYNCYISSYQSYDRGSVHLSVIKMGTSPFLSVMWKEANVMNVSCESAGWYPQPALRWLNHKQDLTPKSLWYSNSSSGLVSVHSWVLISSSSDLSCSVGHSDREEKVVRAHLEKPAQPAKDSGLSVAGWVVSIILFLLMLALLGWLFFKHRALVFGKKNDHVYENELAEPLLNETTAFTEANKYYVNISVDNVTNHHVIIKGCKLRDRNTKNSDGPKVTCLTAVTGTPGFSSGQHYWEVSLTSVNTDLKKSWWLGVANAAVLPEQPAVPLTSSTGFWFLSSSPDRADSFQFSTEPKVSIPVISKPHTVGVHLNYDSGELSFYNVEKKCLIGSLTATFTGQVFPFFNPGSNDIAPMEILHKTVETESSDVKAEA